ncbi:MAG: hypothetical protein ACRD5Z_06500 [Bryobacteraceae bacterium]
MKKHLVPVVALAVAGLFAVAGSSGALAQGGGGAGGGGGGSAGGAGGAGTGSAAGGGDSNPNGPIGNPNPPAGNTDRGVLSRPLGGVKDETPTDPNKASEPAVKDIEKETQKQ